MDQLTSTNVKDALPPRDNIPFYGKDYSIPVITNLTGELNVLFRYDFTSLGWVFCNFHEGPSKDDYAQFDLDRITRWAPVPKLA
jgi:hypothetical protein